MLITPDQFKTLNSDEQLSTALHEIEDGARPLVVCFRDGKDISGNWCRFTYGTLALLDASGNAIFAEGSSEPTVRDCIEALYICSERHQDRLVWIVDNPELLAKAVDRFSSGFFKRGLHKAADDFYSWILEMYGTMQAPVSEGHVKQGQWWADGVDGIASEYHWDEEYILWRLPIVRAYQYQESIAARKGGGSRVNEIPDSMCSALLRMDEVLGVNKNGQS